MSLVLGSCATPVAPTGGPVDRTAPRLVASSPEADAVDVAGRTVRLTFSERVDAATAQRAVTVTPGAAPGEPAPEVSASGDEIVVTLPALRDSTTYVVTVGTELADRRGVRLPAPLTLAFATGPTLDRGEIAGTVRQPTDGSAVAGLAVFAYRVLGDSLPDPRTARPDARTETGPDGAFRLGYLADVPHFVAALRDLNRNGRADDGEPFAAPPRPRLHPAAPGAPDASGAPDVDLQIQTGDTPRRPGGLDLWLARRDTVPPTLRSATALTERRIEFRFSEGVELSGGDATRDVAVTRLAGGAPGDLRATLTLDPSRPATAVAWLSRPAAGDSLAVALDAVQDSTGNRFRPGQPAGARVPARPDTARTRVLGLDRPAGSPDSVAWVLRQGFSGVAAPTLRLSGPSAVPVVLLGERAGGPGDGGGLDTLSASGYRLPLTYPGAAGAPDLPAVTPYHTVRGPLPDTTVLARARAPEPEELGAIVAVPPRSLPDSLVWWIEATPVDGGPVAGALYRRATPSQAGGFALAGLPPGAYRVRVGAFAPDASRPDALTRPTWSGGSLAPYIPPAPLVILAEPVEVRARWETEIDAALLAPLFDASPDDAAAPAPDR